MRYTNFYQYLMRTVLNRLWNIFFVHFIADLVIITCYFLYCIDEFTLILL
jgi:hypothetical protein